MNTFNRVRDYRACFVFLAVCILGLCSPAWAPAGQGEVKSEEARAVIKGKGPDAIVMSVHGFKNLKTNTLVVPYNPMIYDDTGRAIELKDLKIPCEATVSYRQTENSEPKLYRLEVKNYGDNASEHFTQGERYSVGEKKIAKPIEVDNPVNYPPAAGPTPKMQ